MIASADPATQSVDIRREFMFPGGELTEKRKMRKGPTYTGGFIGGLIGSFIPSLWGAGQFSLWSIAFFVLGGFFGVWVGYRLAT